MNLSDIKLQTGRAYLPTIRQQSADILIDILKQINADSILEIGTFVGYSGSLMLHNCNGRLTTIEKDPVLATYAKENFKKEGLLERVTLIEGDAGEVIERLDDKFDLIFLDGPKGQYFKYLPTLKKLLKVGGVLVSDDILFHGYTFKDPVPHKHRTIVNSLRSFIDNLQSDPAFETQLLKIEDGLLISKKLRD